TSAARAVLSRTSSPTSTTTSARRARVSSGHDTSTGLLSIVAAPPRRVIHWTVDARQPIRRQRPALSLIGFQRRGRKALARLGRRRVQRLHARHARLHLLDARLAGRVGRQPLRRRALLVGRKHLLPQRDAGARVVA